MSLDWFRPRCVPVFWVVFIPTDWTNLVQKTQLLFSLYFFQPVSLSISVTRENLVNLLALGLLCGVVGLLQKNRQRFLLSEP